MTAVAAGVGPGEGVAGSDAAGAAEETAGSVALAPAAPDLKAFALGLEGSFRERFARLLIRTRPSIVSTSGSPVARRRFTNSGVLRLNSVMGCTSVGRSIVIGAYAHLPPASTRPRRLNPRRLHPVVAASQSRTSCSSDCSAAATSAALQNVAMPRSSAAHSSRPRSSTGTRPFVARFFAAGSGV